MTENSLLTEGDVNFAPSRKNWYSIFDTATTQMLDEDADLF
jgi:hypothetical protein